VATAPPPAESAPQGAEAEAVADPTGAAPNADAEAAAAPEARTNVPARTGRIATTGTNPPAPVTVPAQPAGDEQLLSAAQAAQALPVEQAPAAATPGSDPVRVIQVSPGSSLYVLMTDIYGTYDPRYLPRIQAMNPQMTDPNYIMAGDELRFPEDLAEAARKNR
jgi:hypothetical protein